MATTTQALPAMDYPESDGKPMAENTLQLRWIMVLVGNLQALFADDPDVFVAGNQNWYPIQGCPTVVMAPDAYVVFGRPKGERGSWRQWEEGDTPMTVVFEVLSPGNTVAEMVQKYHFYDDHGVEEYYIYDPDRNHLEAYVRGQATLVRHHLDGGVFVSPRLGVRFDLSGPGEMRVSGPDGSPFLTIPELTARGRITEEALQAAVQGRQAAEEARQAEAATRQAAEERAQAAVAARQAAEVQAQAAVAGRQAAEEQAQAEVAARQAEAAARQAAEERAQGAEERIQAEVAARQAAEQALAAGEARSRRLRDLVRLVRLGQASPDDLAELDRLEGED